MEWIYETQLEPLSMDIDSLDCTTDALYMYGQVDNRAALTCIENL